MNAVSIAWDVAESIKHNMLADLSFHSCGAHALGVRSTTDKCRQTSFTRGSVGSRP